MQNDPRPYELYRHFKGMMYQVLCIARDSEDGSKQVVYQQLYEPFEVYVRPYDMFISKVDTVKYPTVEQEYRFEYVSGPMGSGDARVKDTEIQPTSQSESQPTPQPTPQPEVQPEPQPEVQPEVQPETEQMTQGLDPLLIDFLDADTAEQKLDVLRTIPEKVSGYVIDVMEESLDMEVTPNVDPRERFLRIKDCLLLRIKYEGSRLR